MMSFHVKPISTIVLAWLGLTLDALVFAADAPSSPPRPDYRRPYLPDRFQARTMFVLPLAWLNGYLFVEDGWWSFETNAQLIADSYSSSAAERKTALKRLEQSGMRIEDDLGIATNRTGGLEAAWFEAGPIDMSNISDDFRALLSPFLTCAPHMVEAFDQWPNLAQAEPVKVWGEDMIPWQAPEPLSTGYNATFYTTLWGALRALAMEAPPGMAAGQHSTLIVQFEDVGHLGSPIMNDSYDDDDSQGNAMTSVLALSLTLALAFILL